MKPIVELDWPEVIQGAIAGIMRHVSSLKQGLDPSKTVNKKTLWENEIIGSLGEMAFAKYANLYNSYSVNSFKRPDIGKVQVRASSCEKGRLIIQEHDPDNDPYVFVTGQCNVWTIQGWITGKQGKGIVEAHPEQKNFWVPIADLEDIETLPEIKKP